MKTKIFGASGAHVPVIGQGTWNFPSSGNELQEAKRALAKGVELGMTHIDTAEMYGSGRSEEIIADALKGVSRQKLFIVSKVLPDNATFKGTIKACESSLKRLRTDYLDCYLLHWRGSVPLEETMSALDRLVDDGKIRSLGVSNFDIDDMMQAQELVSKHPIVCNQVLYHLKERGIERKLVPYCAKHNIAVVAYTPFGQKPVPGQRTKGGAVLAEIAERHDATVRQIILAFLVREKNVFTIPKSASVDHTTENAGAGDITLSRDDIAAIDAAFPAPDEDVPLAML